jgi:MFS family permease
MKTDVTRETWFTGLSRNTVFLALASLFSDISTEMLYPILPTYLTGTLKAGGSVVGLIEGVATALQNLIQGLSGSLSDRFQRRKPLALIGFAVSALSKPLIGAAGAWPGVLGARASDRLGAGFRSAPRDALVAASADEGYRGKAFGLEGAGDNAGAFIGPLITVALLALFAPPLRWVFFQAVIPGALAFLMVLLVKERRTDQAAKTKLDVGLSRFPATYGRYLAVTALFGLGNSANAFLILQTQALGASLETTILIYAGYNLLAALVSYPAGDLSDRVGRKRLLVAGFAVYAVSYVGFALTRSILIIGLLFALYGVFQGVYRAVGKAMAADLAPPQLRASGIGWYSATVGVTGLIASLVAGELWDHQAHALVFLVGAGFAIVGILAALTLIPSRIHARRP